MLLFTQNKKKLFNVGLRENKIIAKA